MPTPRASGPSPLPLLAVATVGFVGWVVYDALYPLAPRPADPPPPPLDVILANKAFASLHLGMPQPLVAEYLHGAGTILVDPVELSGDAPVYTSRHHVHLLHPLPQAEPPGPFVPGPHVVTLVFDARLPGHPLSRMTAVPVARAPVAAALAE